MGSRPTLRNGSNRRGRRQQPSRPYSNAPTRPARRLTSNPFRFFGRVVTRLRDIDLARAAGSLSFTTVLALVPLLTVAFSFVARFPIFEDWLKVLEQFMLRHMLPFAGAARDSRLHHRIRRAGGATDRHFGGVHRDHGGAGDGDRRARNQRDLGYPGRPFAAEASGRLCGRVDGGTGPARRQHLDHDVARHALARGRVAAQDTRRADRPNAAFPVRDRRADGALQGRSGAARRPRGRAHRRGARRCGARSCQARIRLVPRPGVVIPGGLRRAGRAADLPAVDLLVLDHHPRRCGGQRNHRRTGRPSRVAVKQGQTIESYTLRVARNLASHATFRRFPPRSYTLCGRSFKRRAGRSGR